MRASCAGGGTLAAPPAFDLGERARTESSDTPPGDAPVRETGLICGVEERAIVVVPYRPDWPETFRQHRERIAAAIGAGAPKGAR